MPARAARLGMLVTGGPVVLALSLDLSAQAGSGAAGAQTTAQPSPPVFTTTVGSAVSVDVDLLAVSGAFARGNENNQHEPDGSYYLGPGSVPGHVIVNLGATYRLRPWVQLVAQVSNLFDRRYYTAAQLGPLGFTDSGAFVARPFPAVDGAFPVRRATFYAPGAPARLGVGTRLKF